MFDDIIHEKERLMRSTNYRVQSSPYAMSKVLRLLILVAICFGCVSQVQGAIVFLIGIGSL